MDAAAGAKVIWWTPREGHHALTLDEHLLSAELAEWAPPAELPTRASTCLVTGWPLLKRPHVAVGVTEI
jgi:hypothetical protein